MIADATVPSGALVGIPITIIETELPESSVEPDVAHTLRFDVTPDEETWGGRTEKITIEVSDAESGLVETCIPIVASFRID